MRVGLLGHGNVGSGVSNIIDRHETYYTKQIEVTKILVKDASEAVDERMVFNIDDVINSDVDTVVECMGGLEIPFEYISKAIKAKKNIVTSNKKVMATYYDELVKLANENNVYIVFEASVGGGIPVMENIRHTKRVDCVASFTGIFNGTTNFILDKMFKEGDSFEDVLKVAQELGYAEKNPSDDVDGHDVRYKSCLTGNMVWNTSLNLEDINTIGVRNVTQRDIYYGKRTQKTLKLIGRGIRKGNHVEVLVQPEFINNTDTLSHVHTNLNCIEITSNNLGSASYIGQGAGKLPTAHAVVQDIISILKKEDMTLRNDSSITINNEDYMSNYYVRSKNIDLFKDYVLKEIETDVIITKPLNIIKMNELIKESNDEQIFVAGVSI